MNINLVFTGLFEDKNKNSIKAVLQEKNGDRRYYIDILHQNSETLKYILSNEEYYGIYAVYISTIEKFGFTIKKMNINVDENISSVIIIDGDSNEFVVKIETFDAIILCTYNDSPIYIDEKYLNDFQKIFKEKPIFVNNDLCNYTLGELYNMLKRVNYDDDFLEEAMRIKDEIKLREEEKKLPYYNGPDLIY